MAMPFSACIMIVAPFVARLLHGPQDLAVGRVEDARVGHEELEARHALVDERCPSPCSDCSFTSETIMWKP